MAAVTFRGVQIKTREKIKITRLHGFPPTIHMEIIQTLEPHEAGRKIPPNARHVTKTCTPRGQGQMKEPYPNGALAGS